VRTTGRDEPLPSEMQGLWVDPDATTVKLTVSGAEITCFGRAIEYDYKEIHEGDGALTVSPKLNDEAQEDSFRRSNITGLAITPEGEFHAYNFKFASQLVRAGVRPISASARDAFTRISGRCGLSELHIKPSGGLEVVDWIVLDNWHAELKRYCDIFGQAAPHAEIEWQE
jgi:hypothetical protein